MAPLIAAGVLMLALAGQAWGRCADRPGRIAAATVAAGAGVAVALVVISGLAAPFSPWDTVRLAPAMALIRGFNPYAGAGSGAVLSTMYGPVALAAFVPAALAGDAASAAILGRWLAFAFCMVPLVVACRVGAAGARGWRGLVLVGSTLGLLLSPALRYSTTFLHADAPALGLAATACLLASGPRGPGLAAAVACALAIGAKQTFAPLPLALLGMAGRQGGGRAAVRFAAVLAAVGAASLGLVAWLFDRSALYLNLVQVPGGVPWRGRFPGNLAETAAELALHAAPILAAWWAVSRGAVVDAASRRRSHAFALAALALAPMAVLGRVKQAGDLNSFSPCLYPLLLAAASRAADLAPPEAARLRWLAPMLVALLTLFGSLRLAQEVRALAVERPFASESDYLAAHPGEVYFPWNPAVHLAVEGRPTHHLFSAWERGVAGYPVREAHLRSGLPPGCRYVAFPLKRLGPVVGFGSCVAMLERYDLLAKPARPVRLAGLPDYECYALRR